MLRRHYRTRSERLSTGYQPAWYTDSGRQGTGRRVGRVSAKHVVFIVIAVIVVLSMVLTMLPQGR